LFSTSLSQLGWVSVIIGVVGVLLLSKVKFTFRDVFQNPGAGFGLASGLAVAITTLLIRESSLALNTDLLLSAAVTLAFMVSVQSLISFIYIYIQDSQQLKLMVSHWRLCLFVGITSVVGSIGWFTAASFQNAAYVKALGQVEFFITLFITYRIFREKISLIEYLGMALILISVVILLVWA
jgi:drug/metabolite transporter (DMT)-like permease